MLADSSASAHLCRAYLARPIASASRHHLLLSHQHQQQQLQQYQPRTEMTAQETASVSRQHGTMDKHWTLLGWLALNSK